MNPLVELVLKVSLILSAALVIAASLRRRSAELRHWVLSVALVCAAVTPVLMLLAPVWHAPVATWFDQSREAAPLDVAPTDGVSPALSASQAPLPSATTHRPSQPAAVPLGPWLWLVGAVAGGLGLIAGH